MSFISMAPLHLARSRRSRRVRAKVRGTAKRPRLSVYRSSTTMYVQVIDDQSGRTLLSHNDRGLEGKTKTERALALGKKVAEMAKQKKITTVVFDRNGFLYQGRVSAVARGARDGGLIF
jgi:large subunit ribosomal protein L18